MARQGSNRVLWICSAISLIGIAALVVLIGVALRPGRPATVAKARHEIAMRRFHSAASMLSDIIKAQPENVAARIARGECYVSIGRYDYARADFKGALKLSPGYPEAELGMALVLAGEGKHADALAAAQKIVEARPAMLKAYATLGRIHYRAFESEARECVRICEESNKNRLALAAAAEVRLGRFKSAEAYWQEWYGRKPGVATRSGLRTHLDKAKEQLALALQNLKIGAGMTGEHSGDADVDAFLQLAAALLGTGDIDEAEKVALVMRSAGDDGQVHSAIIRAEVFNERADRLSVQAVREEDPELAKRAGEARREAISLLEEVLRKHPHTAPIRDKLAALYVRVGMFDDADRLLRHETDRMLTVNARYVRGIVYLAKGEYDLAVTEFTEISDKMQGNAGFHFSFGMAHYRGGSPAASFARAADQFRRVVTLRPDFVPARFRLAKLLLREGWYKEAREQCEKILAIPGRSRKINAQVYLMLSEASRGLHDYEGVYRALELANDAMPTESTLMKEYLFMIGYDREDDVLKEIGRLVEEASDTPTYACIRGYAYLKKGMVKEAVDSFKTALFLDPHYIVGYVHLAGAYEALRQYDEAVKQYEEAIQKVKGLRLPENPTLHYRLGALFLKQRSEAKGEKELRRALEIDDKHVPARLRLAALELSRGNFKEALRQAKAVTRFAGKSPEARFLVGLIYSASARRPDSDIKAEIAKRRETQPKYKGVEPTPRDIQSQRRLYWDLAVEHYERAMALNPRFSHSYEVGVVYAIQRKFEKMASVYQRALEVAPPRAKPQLLRWLATAHVCAGDYEEAVKAADQAVTTALALGDSDPNEVLRNRFALMNCLVAQGNFVRARVEANKWEGGLPGLRGAALTMIERLAKVKDTLVEEPGGKPLNRHVLVARQLSLGFFFSRAGIVWLSYAENAYKKLLMRDPHNIIALHQLSDLYLVTSRSTKEDDPLAKAEAVNRRILKLTAKFAPTLRNLAAIENARTQAAAHAAGTTEERLTIQAKAISFYEDAIRAAPGFWIAKLELATLYQRAGANEKAMRLYQDVIELRPGEVRALNDYANLCLEENKNLDRAVEYAKRAQKLSPFSGAIADTLGALHTVLGNVPEAVNQLEQARSLLPNHPSVLYHLAVAYEKGKKTPEAIAVLENLLKKDPKHEEARVLLKKLKGE